MQVDGIETPQRLVAATRQAINELGLPAVTAREITGRAAANLAAIPYHFGTKDALVTAALVAEARELLAPALALLGEDQPPAARANGLVTALNQIFEDSRDRVPTYLAALAEAPHSTAVHDGITALWHEVRDAVATDIRGQRDAGVLPSWIDTEAMSSLIMAVVHGVVVMAAIDPHTFDHRAVAAQFLSMLLAVAAAASPERPASDS